MQNVCQKHLDPVLASLIMGTEAVFATISGYLILHETLSEQIRTAILTEYFSGSGRLCIDTQTAYMLCLNFGVYVDKNRIVESLKRRLQKDCWKIKGGFVGATMMCRVLAENGMEDLPQAIGLIESGDVEFFGMSFAELQTLFFRGFNPPLVQQGTKRLFGLKAF